MTDARRGLAYGVTAYVSWGIAPVYWKWMGSVPAIEILAHRVMWGALTLIAIVRLGRAGASLRAALSDRRTVGMMALSGSLLAINWGTYIGAVSAGRLLDASLGYFITPLVSVLFGTLVLRERLRPLQWIAIGLALAGVAISAWQVGHVPWISLVIALSSGQLILAIAVYGEPLARGRLAAFVLIWVALVSFTLDLVRAARAQPKRPVM